MEEVKPKQNLADIARKKRYLHLIEKLHSGTPLTKVEIKELVSDHRKGPDYNHVGPLVGAT